MGMFRLRVLSFVKMNSKLGISPQEGTIVKAMQSIYRALFDTNWVYYLMIINMNTIFINMYFVLI